MTELASTSTYKRRDGGGELGLIHLHDFVGAKVRAAVEMA